MLGMLKWGLVAAVLAGQALGLVPGDVRLRPRRSLLGSVVALPLLVGWPTLVPAETNPEAIELRRVLQQVDGLRLQLLD